MSYSGQPRIKDPNRHPRDTVNLRVAALYLDVSEATVKARIDDGQIDATIDGKCYRISLRSLVAYRDRLRLAS